MSNLMRRSVLLATAGIALAGATLAALAADDYPSKPIRIVVPYGAGTGLDVLTRSIVMKLGEELKTSILVENLAGSNGIIGTTAVVRAPADGYTLLATTQSHYTAGMMYNNMPYDPNKFIPVARFGQAQLVVVTANTSNFSNPQALVAEAKKSPNKLSFASLGSGSSAHMAGALFNSIAGIQLIHVPYKEASQALTDTIKAGRLKAIAVTGAKRSASLPEVPTLGESGLAGYDMVAWYAFLAPEGTPPDVVQKVSAAVSKITSSPEYAASLVRMGLDPMPDNARGMADKLPAENERWQKIVLLTKAKVD